MHGRCILQCGGNCASGAASVDFFLAGNVSEVLMRAPRSRVLLVPVLALGVAASAAAGPNLLTNPNFDVDLSGRTVINDMYSQVTFDPTLDVNSSPSSGSALYAKTAVGESACYPNLYQCVGGITPGKPYDYGGWAYIPIGQPAQSDAFTGPAVHRTCMLRRKDRLPRCRAVLDLWGVELQLGDRAGRAGRSGKRIGQCRWLQRRDRAGAGQLRFALLSGEHGAAALHRHCTLCRGSCTRGSRRSSGVSRAGHEPRAANRAGDSRRRLPATGTCRLDGRQRWNLRFFPRLAVMAAFRSNRSRRRAIVQLHAARSREGRGLCGRGHAQRRYRLLEQHGCVPTLAGWGDARSRVNLLGGCLAVVVPRTRMAITTKAGTADATARIMILKPGATTCL